MPETVTQDNWDGVYYDRETGEFVVIEIDPNGGATLIDAFTDDELETLNPREFEDLDHEDYFEPVSLEVLHNPAEYTEELLAEVRNAVSGDSTRLSSHFTPVDTDFAITATNLAFDDEAPYRDRIVE